jgi:predicted O-methyltransferase YrrM
MAAQKSTDDIYKIIQETKMNIHDLLNEPPKVHSDSSGNLTSWQLNDDVLYFIDKNIDSTSHTLETGAGISTILFAIKYSHHICVVPDNYQVQRIKEYCIDTGIPIDHVKFETGVSEQVLPQSAKQDFDLVLIDGRHAFPTPFIDWYYTTPNLKIGGIVVIDDTHLWTGKVLKQFLLSEGEWQLIKNFSRSAAFAKLKEGSHEKEWINQPFVVQNSMAGIRKEQIHYGFKLIREGKLSTVLGQFAKRFGFD